MPAQRSEEALLRQWEPLVRQLAFRFEGVAEREDLEQIARCALWQAARRFDPTRGCQFTTYAFPTIQGALLRYLRDRALPVKIPRAWWELRPRLRREAEVCTQELGREPTVADRLEFGAALMRIMAATVYETSASTASPAVK